MKSSKIKRIFIAGAVLLLVMAAAFGYMLNISTLKNNLSESIKSTYTVTGNEAVRIIEYSVKYGKPLDSFFGMDNILKETLGRQELITGLSVFNLQGKILYDQRKEDLVTVDLNEEQRKQLFEEQEQQKSISIDNGDSYHILIPIKGTQGAVEGGLDIALNSQSINSQMNQFIADNQIVAMGITFMGVLLMIWRIPKILLDEEGVSGKKVMKMLIVILMMVQGCYGIYTLYKLNSLYSYMAERNGTVVANIVSDNTNRLAKIGLGLDDFKGIEKWLKSITESLPDVENILIENPQGLTVYVADEKADKTINSILSKEIEGAETSLGSIKVMVSQKNIQNKLWNVLLDSLSVLIASILIYVEISRLMVHFLGRHLNPKDQAMYEDSTLIRALAFLFIFSTDLSLSFIPIMSRNTVLSSSLNLPENLAVALPIQAEMLTTSIMALATGIWIDRKGWKPPYMWGIAVVALGSLGCAWATSFWIFVIARGLVGAGYGLSWTSFSGYIGSIKDENIRRRGFADLIAGIYAGSNCGVVTGAMLADRLSYKPVFIVATLIAFLAGIIGFVMVKNTSPHESTGEKTYPVSAFFKDIKILKFFMMLVVPGMSILMFLNYFVPLYSQTIKMSNSNLGRLFLIYGLAIIYLGPYLTEKLGKWMSSRQMMLSASLLVSLSLIVFALKGNVWMLVITVVLISIADSYGLTANTAYYTELEGAKKLGRGKAIGILSTVRKFGMMLGPYLFGLAFIYPQQIIMMGIGMAYLILILAYGLGTRKEALEH